MIARSASRFARENARGSGASWTCRSGCCARSGARSGSRYQVPTPSGAPILTVPAIDTALSVSSPCARSISLSMRSADWRKRSPAAVSDEPAGLRSSSFAPRSRSSPLIRRVTVA